MKKMCLKIIVGLMGVVSFSVAQAGHKSGRDREYSSIHVEHSGGVEVDGEWVRIAPRPGFVDVRLGQDRKNEVVEMSIEERKKEKKFELNPKGWGEIDPDEFAKKSEKRVSFNNKRLLLSESIEIQNDFCIKNVLFQLKEDALTQKEENIFLYFCNDSFGCYLYPQKGRPIWIEELRFSKKKDVFKLIFSTPSAEELNPEEQEPVVVFEPKGKSFFLDRTINK